MGGGGRDRQSQRWRETHIHRESDKAKRQRGGKQTAKDVSGGGGRPWQVPSERVPAGDALADWSQGLPPACLNACRVPPPLPQVPRGAGEGLSTSLSIPAASLHFTGQRLET